jgi:TPR repeat protein
MKYAWPFLRFVLVAWVLAAASSAAHADALDIAKGRRLFDARQFEAAFAILQPLAEAGEPDAQYLMGKAYENGSGPLLYNAARSLNWYLKAATTGHKCTLRRIAELAFFDGEVRDQRPLDADFVRRTDLMNSSMVEQYQSLIYGMRHGTENQYDDTTALFRFGLIFETGWLLAAQELGLTHFGSRLKDIEDTLKANEFMVAEKFAQEWLNGELVGQLVKTIDHWPSHCKLGI